MNENSETLKPGKRFSNQLGNTRGNQINGRANKDRRRAEAFARLDVSDKLSLEQKLKRLPADGAQRQRERYERLIADQKAKQAAKKVAKADAPTTEAKPKKAKTAKAD